MSERKPFDQDKADITISSQIPRTRSHNRVKRSFDAPGASNKFLKRAGAAALLLGGGGLAAHEVLAEDTNQYKVDTAVIATMPAEEIAENFQQIAVREGDTIYGLADAYMAQHGIKGDRYEIIAALSEQAETHDIAQGRDDDGLIQPGEQFILPK